MKTKTLNILMIVSLAVLVLSLISGFWVGKNEFEEKAELRNTIHRFEEHHTTELQILKDSVILSIRDSVTVFVRDSIVPVYDTVPIYIPVPVFQNQIGADVNIYTDYARDSEVYGIVDVFGSYLVNYDKATNFRMYGPRYTDHTTSAIIYNDPSNLTVALMIRDSISMHTGVTPEVREGNKDKPTPLIEVHMLQLREAIKIN